MKVVTEILQDLEILKRLLKHNANLKIRINYYLTKHKLWALKRTISLRRFFWAPKAYVKTDGLEKIYNLTLKRYVYLNLWNKPTNDLGPF